MDKKENQHQVSETKEKIIISGEKEASLSEEKGEKITLNNNFVENKERKHDNRRRFGSLNDKSKRREKEWEKRSLRARLITEKLETKRPTKVTKGGRRFSFTVLVLVKNQEEKTIAFARASGKESSVAFRKSVQKAQNKLKNYFPNSPPTIPRDIKVSYKATTILLKPAPPGSGIKAGGILNKFFKMLEIKDISSKIIGSRNKANIIRAAFMAVDKLTGKKYDY